MNKSKRIIIVGAGGSGKDYLKQTFIKKGFKASVSYTTRPPREGEVYGVDYYFCADHQFKEMMKYDEFFEVKEFRGWFYGTSKKEFEEADIFIMTPSAISELSKEIRETSLIIYIDINETIRGKRLSNRNDADSVKRRLEADRKDFEYFVDFDIRISEPNF